MGRFGGNRLAQRPSVFHTIHGSRVSPLSQFWKPFPSKPLFFEAPFCDRARPFGPRDHLGPGHLGPGTIWDPAIGTQGHLGTGHLGSRAIWDPGPFGTRPFGTRPFGTQGPIGTQGHLGPRAILDPGTSTLSSLYGTHKDHGALFEARGCNLT